jgi:alpha/beta hydrolase fold
MPALQAQLLDVGASGLRHPQPVQGQQGDQRMFGRRAEPGGDQQDAQLVTVQRDGMRLIVDPRSPGGGPPGSDRGALPRQRVRPSSVCLGQRHLVGGQKYRIWSRRLSQVREILARPGPQTRVTDPGFLRVRRAPPLLLLHGYPQSHLIWRDVAPALAEDHTVVLADLRGYGDSDKPAPDAAGLATSIDYLAVRPGVSARDHLLSAAGPLTLPHPRANEREAGPCDLGTGQREAAVGDGLLETATAYLTGSTSNAGCLGATARIWSSLESGPVPSKKIPTSAFHLLR